MLDSFFAPLFIPESPSAKHIGVSFNAGERCLELMRGIGYELLLPREILFKPVDHPIERSTHHTQLIGCIRPQWNFAKFQALFNFFHRRDHT
ncbi:hypothetical protein D3C81_964250 [compost metagenome]